MPSDDRSPDALHEPVLVDRVVELLDPSPDAVILDCTFGSGGHAEALTNRLGEKGVFVALDWDEHAPEYAGFDPVERACSFHFIRENFARADQVLDRLDLDRADGVLADLGWSMDQLKRSGLGLTFEEDEFLDMRLNPEATQTAADLLHEASVEQLTDLFRLHGEHRFGQRLARKIVEEREGRPVRRTLDLVDLIIDAAGRGRYRDVAARVFQALRTEVNDELHNLERLLETFPDLLAAGGRGMVISFHSLEDRRVKNAFRTGEKKGLYRQLTDGPESPDPAEVQRNPAARSARLRAVERREA